MKYFRWLLILSIVYTTRVGLSLKKADYEPIPLLRGDETIKVKNVPPYSGVRQSPGDQIGTTAYDYQASCSFGQRIMVDDYGQAHIDWMWQDYPGQTMRYCAWNARFTDGTYYGETQVSNSWSGYVQLDVTRDTNPDNQRTVVCYHYNAGSGYYGWIDIDGGNLWGTWPNDPKTPAVADHIWPVICVANNNNILMATGDYNASAHHLYLTTDLGNTWTNILNIDSCAVLSGHLRSSGNAGSNRVVFANTRYITDTIAGGQLDNDVWYIVSDDGGMTWDSFINITHYQAYDTVRAYCDVNAVFDQNDILHIAWTGRKVDTAGYYEASKIFHWDEVNNVITVINSPSIYYNEPGGWWISGSLGSPGAWRLPADEPQLIVDRATGYLYCLWHGNDDTTDVSQAGYFNGEIYGAFSTDGGLSWSDYVDLTNTHSPGGGPGECYDEDYLTANPYVVNDSIWTTYIEDKDAGSMPHGESTVTENPVRCWVFPTTLITGAKEHSDEGLYQWAFEIYPNPVGSYCRLEIRGSGHQEKKDIKIYDAAGREIMAYEINNCVFDINTEKFGCGVYFIRIEMGDKVGIKKIVKM